MTRDRILWKDGEFWTALAIGVGVGVWCKLDESAITGIRSHLGDLLSVTGIVFGFVLTTLFFYVQASGSWAFAKPDSWPKCLMYVCYGILGFLASYSGFRIVNHTLTVRWVFRKRHHLQTDNPPKTTKKDIEDNAADESEDDDV